MTTSKELIIPVVNLYFGETYTGNEKITFSKNEHYLAHSDSTEDKRVTDSSFIITRADQTSKRYHIECEEQLKENYRYIRSRLDDLQRAGEIDDFVKNAICSMSNHVMALIAQKYENVRRGVEPIMGGKIIEYEAKTILNKGIEKGRLESAISTLNRYIRRKLPIDAQVLADIAEDNKLTVEKVRSIAKDNGISLSC